MTQRKLSSRNFPTLNPKLTLFCIKILLSNHYKLNGGGHYREISALNRRLKISFFTFNLELKTATDSIEYATTMKIFQP